MEVVEDEECTAGITGTETSLHFCMSRDEELSHEYKSKAVDYWRSGKKKLLSIGSVCQKFRRVKSVTTMGS